MRPHFPILLATILLFAACAPDRHFPIPPPKSALPAHDLSGAVHTVRQVDSTFTDSISPPRIVIRSYTFTPHGQLSKAIHEVPGEVRNERTYLYDSLHRKAEYLNSSSQNEYKTRELSLYAPHGLLAERQTFNEEGELMEKGTYEYNDEGKVILHRQFLYTRKQGKERETAGFEVRYEYDGEGRVEEKRTKRDGEVLQKEVYANGELVETQRFEYQSGEPSGKVRHSRKDRVQIDSTFLPDGKLVSIHREETNAAGKPLRVVQEDFAIESYSEITSTYNAQGDLATKRERYKSEAGKGGDYDLGLWTFTYTYDTLGNWTRKVQERNGRIESITTRTITYH